MDIGHKYIQNMVDKGLMYEFVERWHREMDNFDLLPMEMKIMLDDFSCLLCLPNTSAFISYLVSRNMV